MRRVALLLAAAVLIHNLEEWIALGLMPEVLGQFRQLTGLPIPDLATTRAALVGFALFPLIILLRFALRPGKRLAFLACMVAAMAVANALAPHFLLALATGGYVPGLTSALLLTLPLGLFMLWQVRREKWLSARAWTAAVATGILLVPAVLTGFWALGELAAEFG